MGEFQGPVRPDRAAGMLVWVDQRGKNGRAFQGWVQRHPQLPKKGQIGPKAGRDYQFIHFSLSAIDGKQAEDVLHQVGITVNRNSVPFDPRPPMVTSGVRIGTPALATRGFDDAEFTEVADVIASVLKPGADLEAARSRVKALADAFPLYQGL